MEQRFDHDQWLAVPSDSDGRMAHRLEWPALAARLAAGHAFQRSLSQGSADWVQTDLIQGAGSFDPFAVQQMHIYADAPRSRGNNLSLAGFDYPAVNPVASGVRKTMSGKESGVAGPFIPAIEG